MGLNITREQAYAAGRAAGAAAEARVVENSFRWARIQYAGAEGLNLRDELLTFDRRRMAADLDLRKFPECRGLREMVETERQGFLDACPDPLQLAMYHSWYWYVSRVLNTRQVARTPPPAQCTDFWFAETREGGPIHGSNRDDLPANYPSLPIPTRGPAEERFTQITCVGGVSAAVLCDEEPEDWFPVRMEWITPPGIRSLKEFLNFMERYHDFWGPGNRIYVDPDLNFAAVEKANRRMGVRYSTNGACAITACAYLTPEMHAFKKERDAISIKARGWTNDCPDFLYWQGCERRYRRLLQLVEEEGRRGATLRGAARIALDHAVPFPDRICVAGEKGHRHEQLQNWTMTSFVRCISGPNRRMWHWQMDPQKPVPVYRTKPLMLQGDGLTSRPEWERELAQEALKIAE